MLSATWLIKGFREFTQQGFQRASKQFQPLPDKTTDTFLITGADQGIGITTAEQLYRRGATVHLVCSSLDLANDVREKILLFSVQNSDPNDNKNTGKLFTHEVEFSNLKNLNVFVENITEKYGKIDVLINNMGCMIHGSHRDIVARSTTFFKKTKKLKHRTDAEAWSGTSDRIEINYSVNVLAPFFLTKSFLSLKPEFIPSKVITISSSGMYTQKLNPDQCGLDETYPRDATALYAQTKRQQVTFMQELAEIHSGTTHFSSTHSGWTDFDSPTISKIPNHNNSQNSQNLSPDTTITPTQTLQTQILQNSPSPPTSSINSVPPVNSTEKVQHSKNNNVPAYHQKKMTGKWRSPEQGADTVVWLALNSSEHTSKMPNGKLWFDRKQTSSYLTFDFTSRSSKRKDALMSNLDGFYKKFNS